MPWLNALLVVVAYCGSIGLKDNVTKIDACRVERSECIRRGAERKVLNNDIVNLVNACLAKPDQFTGPLPPPEAPAKVEKKKAEKKK